MKHLRNTIIFTCLAVFSALFTFGCASGPTTPGAGIGTETTTIYGRVVDESGLPVATANLTAGTSSTTTDINGFFIMKNVTVPKGRAVVIAKKSGYFSAAHAEVPHTGGTRIDLNMMSDASNASLSAITGGTINAQGGGTVNFAAGSFTDASGNAYTGQVKVCARYLDPKSANFFDFFDGDMMAQRSDGSGASLISSGVLRVELKDPNGNSLKLDPSKPATLNYPKPVDAKAPATMPLWYFDETLGMWKENGSATLANGMYTGTVTHFSDFNLDYFDSTGGFNTSGTVSLRILCSGIPIGGVVITIVGDDGGGKYFVHPGGKTDAQGKITFVRFPANRPVQVTVNANRNGGLYFMNNPVTVTITPGQIKDLGDLSLDSPCPGSVSGLLECSGTGVEGLVNITDGTYTNYMYTSNGNFGIQAPSGTVLTVNAINANGDQANTTTVAALTSGEQRNIGNIDLCSSGTPDYSEITITGSAAITAIALSSDGSHTAVYGGGMMSVYDTKSGNLLSSAFPSIANITKLQFSTDNSLLLASSGNYYTSGSAVLYDITSLGATVKTTVTTILGARLSDDGTKIFGFSGTGVSSVNIYSGTDGSTLSTLNLTAANKQGLGFGYNNDENAIVYQDNQTDRVLSVASNTELLNFPVTGQSYYFSVSDDGHTVASANYNTVYTCYDTKTGNKIGTLPGTNGASRDSSTGALTLTQHNAYSATAITGAVAISIIKIADGTTTLKLIGGLQGIPPIAASRNEQYLAAIVNGKIRIWKLQ